VTCTQIDGFLDSPLAPSQWPAEARGHLSACPRCQALVQGLERFNAASIPPAGLQDAIARRVLAGIGPVRPLPGLRVTALRMGACAAAIAVLAALATGAKGWAALTAAQRVIVLLVSLSALAAQAMIAGAEMEPGRSRPLAGRWLRRLIPAALLLVAILLFPWSPGEAFVAHWAACLGRAAATSIVVFGGVWVWARRGYFVNPVRSGAVLGMLSGLGGFLSQELYCPVAETAHVALAHVGMVVIATLAGAMMGATRGSRTVPPPR